MNLRRAKIELIDNDRLYTENQFKRKLSLSGMNENLFDYFRDSFQIRLYESVNGLDFFLVTEKELYKKKASLNNYVINKMKRDKIPIV